MSTKLHILLIEDNPDDREFYVRLLSNGSFDYEVYEAEDCSQTVEICTEQHIDCALVDYRLPDLDGLDMLDILKKYPRADGTEIPAIMLTGCSDSMIATEAGLRGAMNYIVKSPDMSSQQFEKVILNVINWSEELSKYR